MKKIFKITIFIFSINAIANLDSTEFLTHPLEATYNVLNILANDAPLPLNDAKKGKWIGSFRPSYIQIDQAYFSDEGRGGGASYHGDNLIGRGIGGSYNYSLDDRKQIYVNFNGVWLEGNFIGKEPADRKGNTDRISGKNSLENLSMGFGYDVWDNPETWTFPIFLGIFIQHYKTDMTSEALSNVHADTQIYGEGMQYGFSAGFQLSRNFFEKWQFTPYGFIGMPVSGPEVEVKIVDSQTTPALNGSKESGELDVRPYFAGGINLKYIPWGIGMNVGSILTNIYSKTLYNGLEMTTISFTFDINDFVK